MLDAGWNEDEISGGERPAARSVVKDPGSDCDDVELVPGVGSLGIVPPRGIELYLQAPVGKQRGEALSVRSRQLRQPLFNAQMRRSLSQIDLASYRNTATNDADGISSVATNASPHMVYGSCLRLLLRLLR